MLAGLEEKGLVTVNCFMVTLNTGLTAVVRQFS